MEKTAGIITLYGLNNYGNRLQNYAIQKILTNMGIITNTYNTHVYVYNYGRKFRIKKKFHELTNFHFSSNRINWAKSLRKMRFQEFTKMHLPTVLVEDISTLGTKADFFVLGSDQVWNPKWYRDSYKSKELYLLTFAKSEQKICFSPSFGVSELPDEWKSWFKENLQTFPSLNVREKAGADIIKGLTGQVADITIDPTLMLDANDWLKIAKKPYGINTQTPFILTYFLGKRTDKAESDVHEILKERNMNVYHLLDLSQPFVYACGPSEFLYLFSKADLILTDSYHACVFSFLFGKPFLVYDREQDGMPQMNSRLDTLLANLDLDRKYRNRSLENKWFECNYEDGWYKLRREREIIRDYLRKSFQL